MEPYMTVDVAGEISERRKAIMQVNATCFYVRVCLGSAAHATLCALQAFDNTRLFHASTSEMAMNINASRRTITLGIKQLERAGIISVERSHAKDGAANKYRINWGRCCKTTKSIAPSTGDNQKTNVVDAKGDRQT